MTLAASMILVEGAGWTQSRRTRSAGIGSLLEMKCYGKGLYAKNREGIVINRRTYTSIGVFKNHYFDAISKKDPIEISCDLAARNQSPIYKTLTMTVGSDDNDSYSWEDNYSARVRITTYMDGEPTGSVEVGFRELKRFSLDISGVRSAAFSVECLQSNKKYCPEIFILEDKLLQ